MSNKGKFWLGCSLFFFFVLVFGGCYKYRELEQKGLPVKLKIKEMDAFESDHHKVYRFTFNYKGKEYTKDGERSFYNEHNPGDVVDMKYVEKFNTLLFPDEKVSDSMLTIFGVVLLIVFLIMIAPLFRKDRGIKRNPPFIARKQARR